MTSNVAGNAGLVFGRGNLDLDTVLALVATFLALAVAVQVLQEIYKYVTSSKARAYRIALRSWLGSWVDKNYGSEEMSTFLVSGPFELLKLATPTHFKKRPPARLLPMGKDDLIRAVERTANPAVRETIEALRHDAGLQSGTPGNASAMLRVLIEDLWSKYDKDTDARHVFDFLERWKAAEKPPVGAHGEEPRGARILEPVDAATILKGFSQHFLPERETVEREHEQFVINFEHTYNRRNLRQTMILGLILALGLNLRFDGLYRRAAAMSPEQVSSLVESSRALLEKDETVASPTETGDKGDATPAKNDRQRTDEESKRARLRERLQNALVLTIDAPDDETSMFARGWNQLRATWSKGWPDLLAYLANCLVTAVFVAFGAPFWNGILESLMRQKKSPKETQEGSSKEAA